MRLSRLGIVMLLVAVVTGCSGEPDRDQPSTGPVGPPPSRAVPPLEVPTGAKVVDVGSTAELESALEAAGPGTVIKLAPGSYERDGGDRFVAEADGTADEPIVLWGPSDAVLSSDGIKGDYGLHVTGDYWRIEGLSITEATKGIVMDGSVGTVISGVDVGNVGEEGVHFRMCSSNGVLQNSTVHDTGLQKPRFGEGVYVGSANSNWDKYACDGDQDNTEGVLIEGNTFTDIAAEGADLKEGVDSGTLRGNTFDNAGYSGDNSADSAIDVKSNGWLIEDNLVKNPTGEALDGIQTHSVYDGYGTDNTFTGNTIEGDWPGFGIGLYPKAGNVVDCDNTAPGAGLGLVGDGEEEIDCD